VFYKSVSVLGESFNRAITRVCWIKKVVLGGCTAFGRTKLIARQGDYGCFGLDSGVFIAILAKNRLYS